DGRLKLKRINRIIDWANAVNRMEMEDILSHFQFPLNQFENHARTTQGGVTEFYRDLWGKFSSTQLRIQRIEPLSANRFNVLVHYLFAGRYDPNGFHRNFK